MRMSQPRAEATGEASGAGLSHAVPRWLGSPCLRDRAGQGWQEQLLQPGGALGVLGYRWLQGMSRAGDAQAGGRVLRTGLSLAPHPR